MPITTDENCCEHCYNYLEKLDEEQNQLSHIEILKQRERNTALREEYYKNKEKENREEDTCDCAYGHTQHKSLLYYYHRYIKYPNYTTNQKLSCIIIVLIIVILILIISFIAINIGLHNNTQINS